MYLNSDIFIAAIVKQLKEYDITWATCVYSERQTQFIERPAFIVRHIVTTGEQGLKERYWYNMRFRVVWLPPLQDTTNINKNCRKVAYMLTDCLRLINLSETKKIRPENLQSEIIDDCLHVSFDVNVWGDWGEYKDPMMEKLNENTYYKERS